MKRLFTAAWAAILVAGCASAATIPPPGGPLATTASSAGPAPTSSRAPTASPTPPASPAGATPSAASVAPSAVSTSAAPRVSAVPSSPPPSGLASPSASASASAPKPSSTATAAAPSATALRWSRLASPGPQAREDHTLTVDGDGAVAYLYGGRSGAEVFDDLWRLDLATDEWMRVDVATGPAARFGHTATWVPGVGLVVFSGQAGGAFFSDLWAWSPDTGSWRRLPPGGAAPEPRYGSCAGLAPDGRLWISHGFTDQGRFFDTRAYDFATGTWADITREDPVPVIRCLHDCVWTPGGQFVLYGGQTNGVPALGDLWLRPVDGAWQPQADPPLPARQLYAVATLGSRAWIFGGAGRDRAPLRDLWTLDLRDFSWREIPLGGSIPPARLSATLIADPVRSRLLLFGGKSSQAAYDDLWELRLAD